MAGHHPKSAAGKHAVSVGVAAGKTGNTLAPDNRPVSCWRVDDICFAFDKAYLEVNSQKAFDQLHQLLEEAKKGDIMRRYKRLPLLALFGHADRVGKARYNKKLSEARAKCVYGALVRKPQIWIDVFKSFNQTKYLKGRLKKDGYLTAGLGIKDALLQYMNFLCRSLQLEDADFVSGKGY